ncbi:MAG: hypothetical protein QOG13_2689 [Sphingomonadales bacterium]|jgi:hypothetical protein|nr:hypothetical protein [Sphingomonadales bacterium]
MRTIKSVFGLVAAAVPILYCAGLLLYFNRVRTASGGLLDSALGPTMLGLGVIGLLFLIPFVLRLRRLVAPPAAPGSGSSGRRAKEAPQDERSDFDADAALARYLAQRPRGAPNLASPQAPQEGGRPVRQAAFGRRGA